MFVEARRTTLALGKEAEYEAIHASIPNPIANALIDCGLRTWEIWRDGHLLFHVIETVNGYESLLAEFARIGPIDEAWDSVVESLLDSTPGSDVMLRSVWRMTRDGQGRN